MLELENQVSYMQASAVCLVGFFVLELHLTVLGDQYQLSAGNRLVLHDA